MASSTPPAPYLRSLTPLRGIAALWVVLYHFSFEYFPNIHPNYYTHILDKGYLAVDLFFLLSGFVLTHVYADSFARAGGANYWDFLRARVARLYPLHLAVLLLFVATALASRAMDYAATGRFEMVPLSGTRSFAALLANLFMLQGIQAGSLSWNYPAWSVSVEFMAYLLFPFVLPLVWRSRAASQIALAAALYAALGWLGYLTEDNFDLWDGPETLLRCLPEFLLGSLLYRAYRSGVAGKLLARDPAVLGVMAVIALLLHVGAPDLVIVSLFPVLLLAVATGNGATARVLNTPPLLWLGEASYALYLVHGFVQFVTTKVLIQGFGIDDREYISTSWSLALAAGMLALSLLLAGLAHGHIEVAGRRYLRRVFRLRLPGAATAIAEGEERSSAAGTQRLSP